MAISIHPYIAGVPNRIKYLEALPDYVIGHDSVALMTATDIGDWYRAVTVLGTVVEVRDDNGLVDIDRLSVRYRGTPYRNRERKRITALIEPERWHEHS